MQASCFPVNGTNRSSPLQNLISNDVFEEKKRNGRKELEEMVSSTGKKEDSICPKTHFWVYPSAGVLYSPRPINTGSLREGDCWTLDIAGPSYYP